MIYFIRDSYHSSYTTIKRIRTEYKRTLHKNIKALGSKKFANQANIIRFKHARVLKHMDCKFKANYSHPPPSDSYSSQPPQKYP